MSIKNKCWPSMVVKLIANLISKILPNVVYDYVGMVLMIIQIKTKILFGWNFIIYQIYKLHYCKIECN